MDEGDIAGLTAALARALDLPADERGRVQGAARATAERFAWPSMARRHHAHLLAPILGEAP